MKIACISASRVPSSTANSIQAMKACQALAQSGHEVLLIVPRGGLKSEQSAAAEIPYYYGFQPAFRLEWQTSHPSLRRYDFCWRAVQRAKALKADLVYVWPLQAAVLAGWAGLPVILEMHGPPEGRLGPNLFRLFWRQGGKKRILPITQALAGFLQREAPSDRSQEPASNLPSIVISPNGIDLERYQNLPEPGEARAALGLAEMFTAGYTGHLYPGRGMNLLVELARRFPGTHFMWVGGNPSDVNTWRERLATEKIKNITLTGFIDNRRLPTYQAAADVLLMPYERSIAGSSGGNSAEYCSPMKMFEYMACGRAILSSDLPVIHEVLNEKNAVLCPPEDPDAWEHALAALLNDPEQRTRLSRQAHLDAQGYTWLARAQKAVAGFDRA